MNILFELLYNLGILVSISIISGFIGHPGNNDWNRSLLQGLIFGSASVIGMLHPFVVAPGLIFDGRSVMISLSGLFFGPFSSAIAGLMALILRINQGGTGVLTGTLVIIASAFIGTIFHIRNKRRNIRITIRLLFVMGIIVHVAMILLMFTLPDYTGIITIKLIGLPVLLSYPIATVLIGRIMLEANERKQAEERVLYLSYHDELTGLYNRRFYEGELKRLDTKRNLPLTIVMGDVNGLKLINDSFGHASGDELLQKVAAVIKKSCRADDIIARLGGDEFVILLPKTDAFETENIIKRINGLAFNEKVESISISISFGYETKNNERENIQEVFKKAEDYMYQKKLFESPSMRGKTISAIINTLHEKNKREEQHSHRVSELCKDMGIAIGLTEHKIEVLKTVGLLHDIGKIAIDESILNKPETLTDYEWREIQRHSEIGYRILSTMNDMSDMAEYILYHHERWNGSGYPKGLKEEEIPFESRIIAIADAYDAMTSERSYRSALPENVALAELQKNSGIEFDPELVDIFIEKVLGNQ